MDDGLSAPPPPSSHNHLLRRRKSISTPEMVPINHQSSSSSSSSSATTSSTSSSSSSSSSPAEFDLISINPISYTSLKDLLPSMAVNSPKPNSPAPSGSDISIRNRLVKQAAWAYLQPMSSSKDSSGRNLLHRLWIKLLTSNPVAAFRSFFDRQIFRRLNLAFDWLFRAIRLGAADNDC